MPADTASRLRTAPPADDRAGSVLDELLTAQQLAEILQMRVSTIEGYARRGVLPSIKVGRHRRFVRSDVERTVANLAEPIRVRRTVAR